MVRNIVGSSFPTPDPIVDVWDIKTRAVQHVLGGRVPSFKYHHFVWRPMP